MQALLVSMKIPNVLWGMAGRDKVELRSLFQQPGLFMEQNFNRIRAATQSPEIDEFFKKIPKNAVTKYNGRPNEKEMSDNKSERSETRGKNTKSQQHELEKLVNMIHSWTTFLSVFHCIIMVYGYIELILCRIIKSRRTNRRTKSVLDRIVVMMIVIVNVMRIAVANEEQNTIVAIRTVASEQMEQNQMIDQDNEVQKRSSKDHRKIINLVV